MHVTLGRFLNHFPSPLALKWIVRLALLAGIFASLTPPRAYVVIGPPQVVQTQHPITCVHTRLTDEVEEWKIQRSLELTREMGATTIVELFPWAYVEAEQGQYNWKHSDLIVQHAQAQGLTIIARLGLVPDWVYPTSDASQTHVTLNYLTPDHFQDFANFVEQFAAHYQGQIDHIIIWNEPNLAFEWGYQTVRADQYVELLKLAYIAARRGNPAITVLAAGPAPTLEPVGSPYGTNDLDYLKQFYAAGGRAYFDVLAVHSYGLKFPPDDPPAADVLNFRRVELDRQIMVANGDAHKPIYITESGWNDHPRWTKAVRPGQRITYTIDAFKYTEANWPWVERLCVWALRYPAPTNSYPDYYTLITPDFMLKPIYEEIRAWARGETPSVGLSAPSP
jgi:polysaccharide biosynthesis protein PslG